MRAGIILVMILTISITSKMNAQEFNLEKAKAEVEERVREFEGAIRSGDLASLSDLYSIDAEVLNSGPTSIVGRDAIVKGFDEGIKAGWTESGFTTTGVWGCGELLVEQGTGFFATKGKEQISEGRYLMVWKNEDGVWRIFRDTWFSNAKQEDK